jgi:hypothetical protein
MTIGIAQIVFADDAFAAGTTQQATITTSNGSIIAVPCTYGTSGGVTITGVSDGSAYTSTDAAVSDGVNGQACQLFYRENVSSGKHVVTMTVSPTTGGKGIALAEITDGKLSSSLNVHGPGQLQATPGTGTDAITSGAAQTNTGQPALVFGFTMNSGGSATSSIGTGFTLAGTGWGFGTTPLLLTVESKRVTALAGQQATFTGANSAHITQMAVFLELPDVAIPAVGIHYVTA